MSASCATIDPVFSTDTGVELGPQPKAAFLAQTDRESLVRGLSSPRFPLNGAARLQVGTVVAHQVGEAAVKPIGKIEFDLAGPGAKIAATVVLSEETARSLDPATQDGVTAVLTSALARATDVYLVSVLTAGTPTGSATVADLFAAIEAPRRPVLIGGFDTVLALAAGTVRDLQGLGVQIMTSPAAAGLLIAVDAAGVLISDGDVVVETARHADVLLDDGAGSPSGTTVVSLWQQNLAALRAERWLRVAVRSESVAWATVTP